MRGRPFRNLTKKMYQEDLRERYVKLKPSKLPEGYSASKEFCDFINRLLEIDPRNRLGSEGISELTEHAWFSNFEWGSLMDGKLEAPYKPGEIIRRRFLNLRTVALQGPQLEQKQAEVNHNNSVTSSLY